MGPWQPSRPAQLVIRMGQTSLEKLDGLPLHSKPPGPGRLASAPGSGSGSALEPSHPAIESIASAATIVTKPKLFRIIVPAAAPCRAASWPPAYGPARSG